MEWNLCSSPSWVPFYPYTMFQDPMPKPSCQKSRKIIITEKSTCHTKFSHSALQSAYPKPYMCRFSSLFEHFFPVQIDVFFIFCQGELSKYPKILHFVDFEMGEMHQNGLSGTYLEFKACQIQWCRFQVYNKWFLKHQNFRRHIA